MKKFSWFFRGMLFAATAFSVSLSNTVNAQDIPWNQAVNHAMKTIPKRNLGPGAMSGRITALAVPTVEPSNKTYGQTIYAGAASGGVWKSTNGGLNWAPIFDEQDVQSIGALAVDPNNPDVIWAGTGEGNPRNSHNSGKGIYKSLDGGKTWKCLGLEATKTIHRIIVNPKNSQEIYVAAMGSVWGPNDARGVYKTTDGGKTWNKILYTNASSGCADLVIDPSNPNKLFACMYDYQRQPWTFRSGGPGSGLYVTYDAGQTWKKLGAESGLPEGELGRIGIAIPRNQPSRVYALVEAKKSGFYRSNDGGATWKRITDDENAGNRPFYYHEIYAHPENENRVYSIWSQVSVSEDAGNHWRILADWGAIHPDHHAFLIHPRDPNYIINGNDGGLNISYDGGNSWRYAENIPVGQFYHIDIDNELPYNVYGGLQDNGSWVGPAYHWKYGGIKNFEWQEVMFGDGFDCVPMPGKPGEGYAMWQGGNVSHYNTKTHQTVPIKPQHPQGVELRFNWNAAIAVDPNLNTGVYFGSQFVHYSADQGRSWKIISPDLTTNNKLKLQQAKSGGLTVDATGAENHCTILAIAPAANDTKVVWAGTDDGNIQVTRDGGTSWSNVALNIKGAPKEAWVPYLWVNPKNAGECWAVINNYRQNDWNAYLFKTTDFGKTWTSALGTVPAADGEWGYVHSVLPHPQNQNLVFMGTDRGLWMSLNGGKDWMKWKEGFPSVPVTDLKIQSRENDLVVGTFGRGIWVFDHLNVLVDLAAGSAAKAPISVKGIKIAATTPGYLAQSMSNAGMHFGANTEFEAPNKMGGVKIDVWAVTTKNKDQWEKLKLVGTVYNEAGEKIRTHHFSLDSTGLYRIPYRMIRDGVRFPQHGKVDEKSDLPSGMEVAPGKYKMVIRNEGDTLKFADSVWVEVKESGQSPFSSADYSKKLVTAADFAKVVQLAYSSFEALKEAERSLETMGKLQFESDTLKQRYLKESKKITDSLAQLKLKYMLEEGYRFYEDATIRLNDHLYNAAGLLNGSEQVTENVQVAIDNAKKQTDKVTSEVRNYLNGTVKPFLKKAELQGDKIRWNKEIKEF